MNKIAFFRVTNYTYAHMRKFRTQKFNRQGQTQFSAREFRKYSFFGGIHCTRRIFRVARPLSTKAPIHLVLRSNQARGDRSLLTKRNRKFVARHLKKVAEKWGIKVLTFANVGNHLHLLIKMGNLRTYKPFICALTGGIATAVTRGAELSEKFWDFRPYSRIVEGRRGFLTANDYIEINRLEGGGTSRCLAVLLVKHGNWVESG